MSMLLLLSMDAVVVVVDVHAVVVVVDVYVVVVDVHAVVGGGVAVVGVSVDVNVHSVVVVADVDVVAATSDADHCGMNGNRHLFEMTEKNQKGELKRKISFSLWKLK